MKHRLTLAVVLIAAGCNPQPLAGFHPTASPAPTQAGAPPLHIYGPLTHPIVAQRGNRRLYQVAARNYDGISPEGAAHTTFYVADVTFFAKDGSTLQARAPRAVVDQASNTVTLLGGVKARSSNGWILTCNTLIYRSGTERIYGEGNVHASDRRGNRLSGNRVESDVSFNHIRMQ